MIKVCPETIAIPISKATATVATAAKTYPNLGILTDITAASVQANDGNYTYGAVADVYTGTELAKAPVSSQFPEWFTAISVPLLKSFGWHRAAYKPAPRVWTAVLSGKCCSMISGSGVLLDESVIACSNISSTCSWSGFDFKSSMVALKAQGNG